MSIIGITTEGGEKIPLKMQPSNRRRHLYIIGETGTGKSTLIENMALYDIIDNQGIAIIEPHGDLIEKILNNIPKERINDVVYFNPSDLNYSFGFNPLKINQEDKKHLIASGLISVFKKHWAEFWGPRTEYLLRNAILSILDYPYPTLLHLYKLFSSPIFRKRVIKEIKDPLIKSFWQKEFSQYHKQFLTEVLSPIQNKLGQFISTPLIRNIISQVKAKFDPLWLMDNQKIFLCNLSKGKLGEDVSNLLGSLIITQFQVKAMKRANIPEQERKDFYLYIDEFQNFATESFADILAEARKYRLNLILSHQCLSQIPERIKSIILGNIGTLVLFRIGVEDVEILEKEFYGYHSIKEQLLIQENFNFYTRMMINNKKSNYPISGNTLLPLKEKKGCLTKQKIINLSRQRYCTKRELIEKKIERFFKRI